MNRPLSKPFKTAYAQAKRIPSAKNKRAAIHKLCGLLKAAIGK